MGKTLEGKVYLSRLNGAGKRKLMKIINRKPVQIYQQKHYGGAMMHIQYHGSKRVRERKPNSSKRIKKYKGRGDQIKQTVRKYRMGNQIKPISMNPVKIHLEIQKALSRK